MIVPSATSGPTIAFGAFLVFAALRSSGAARFASSTRM